MTDKKESDFDKVFNVWDILVIAFGAMIGWAWVVSSSDWIDRGGVIGAMLGFGLGGIMIFFIGLTYAELTPAMPDCGGEHVFSYRAMGPTGSFVCTWAIILGYVSVVCFEACALPTIVTYLFPSFLQGYLYTVAGFDIYASWLAVAIIMAIFITYINIRGAKTAAIVQTVLTCIIGGAGILLVVGSVISGNPSNLDGQVFVGDNTGSVLGNILRVAMMTPFYFIGFDVIPQAAEEINVPLKKIAKMLLLSILLAVAFYVLIIFAVGYVLSPDAIAQSESSGSGLVTADAMARAFHTDVMAKVLIIGGLCGVLTSWNSFMIGGSRAMYSMAESYMIPPVFGKLSAKYKTPWVSIGLIGLLSCLAPLLGRKMLVWIVDAGNLACCVAYCMVAISFVILRRKAPDMPRPYKVKHYKLVGFMAIAMSGFMVIMYCIPGSAAALVPTEWAFVGGWALLGVIFYFACKARYGKKFGTLVEVANDELDKDYARERSAAASIAAGEAAKGAAAGAPAAVVAKARGKLSTIGQAEVSAAVSAVTSAAATAGEPVARTFSYYAPVNLTFGAGTLARTGELAKPLGSKALIVTGHSSAKKTGVYDKVNDSLKAAGIATGLFDKASANPLTTTVEEGARVAKDGGYDMVVGLGGGSVMDCAKGIAFMAKNDGDVNDYIYGRKSSDVALPLVLIPTTCGSGSEANGFAVLTNPENGDKKSLRCPAIMAKRSIVDPEAMMTMPKGQLAAVGFDAFCHCFEAYTAKNAQPFTDALALYAIPLILDSLPRLVVGTGTLKDWENMSQAATIGGLVIGTAGITLTHAMEHPVSGLKNVTHGRGLAAIAPTVVEATWQGDRFKFGRLARLMGGYTAEDCAEKIRGFERKIGLEVTLGELGISESDIPWLTENAMKVSQANIDNTRTEIGAEDISELYRKAL